MFELLDLKTSISNYSTFYEQLIEHVFISEILQETWFRFGQKVEVLRAEIDASGYDIVLESNNVLRHIQLKTSIVNSSKTSIDINIKLGEKPSGCVIWIEWAVNEQQRIEVKYLFFGSSPGIALPNIFNHKVGKHSKANSEGEKTKRPSIRTIKKSEFSKVNDITKLVYVLFGLGEDKKI